MTKQKLVLHIGLNKTGTTFLQRTLLLNREVLKTAGIHFAPYMDPEKGNHHALRSMLNDEKMEDFITALDGVEGSTVLVTSEGLSKWFNKAKEDALNTLASRLKSKFDVRIVVFIRRQDYLRESVFAEISGSWYTGQIANAPQYITDFDAFLARLEASFGQETIGLGVYRDDIPNDLIADFLSVAGLDLDPALLVPARPQRVSLNRRQTALLAAVDKSNTKQFRRIKSLIVQSNIIRDDGIKGQLSPKRRAQLLADYIAGNKKVAERYGLDCTDFLTAAEGIVDATWKPAKRLSAREVAKLLSALIATEQEQEESSSET